MMFTLKKQPQKQLITAWRNQIRQLAAHHPLLAQQLWRNRQAYFARFVYFYRQLTNLPRKFRRKFLKRLATTLTGAALLLALGQALPARAAVITVDGEPHMLQLKHLTREPPTRTSTPTVILLNQEHSPLVASASSISSLGRLLGLTLFVLRYLRGFQKRRI